MLDRHGMARELSLRAEGNEFKSDLLSSHRVANGVLHNPHYDRRTTKGSFHVVERGLPVPADKKSVPQKAFIESDWYQKGLVTKQRQDIRRAKLILGYIASVRASDTSGAISDRLGLSPRRDNAQAELDRVSDGAYVEFLKGAIGAQPFERTEGFLAKGDARPTRLRLRRAAAGSRRSIPSNRRARL